MNVEFALNILREAPIPMKNQEIFQVMKDQGFTGKKYEVRNFLWSLIDKGVKYRSSPYYDYQIAESITIPNNVKKSVNFIVFFENIVAKIILLNYHEIYCKKVKKYSKLKEKE